MEQHKYIFFAEYKNRTYISQYDAENLEESLKLWAENLDLKYFSESKKEKIIAETKDDDFFPVELDGIKNAWCASYLSGKSFLLLNIVKTSIETNHIVEVQKEIDKIDNLYTFIMYYRGGTYISQFISSDLQQSLFLWAMNLNIKEIKYVGAKSKKKLISEVQDKKPVPIQHMSNVWYVDFIINRIYMHAHIIKTGID